MMIGKISAEPGCKNHGFLKAGERAVSNVDLPVMIVNGLKKGPTLCLTACVHGSEYGGIGAAMEIYRQVDPKNLSGVILIAPVVNVPAFQRSISINRLLPTSYVCPIDKVDLMTVDPTEPDGSMSSLIVRTIFNELILKSDYYIDLHGGSFPKKVATSVTLRIIGNEDMDNKSMSLAKLFPSKYIRVFRVDSLPDGAAGTGLTGNASKKGIPSIMSEAGHSGEMVEYAVEFYINGILNVMKALKMIEGTPERIPEQSIIKAERIIKTKRGGIFFPKIQVESKVSKGDVVGEIKNVFGETIEKLISPCEGLVLWYHYPPPVNSGDGLIKIGIF
jgi:predicted deacylase